MFKAAFTGRSENGVGRSSKDRDSKDKDESRRKKSSHSHRAESVISSTSRRDDDREKERRRSHRSSSVYDDTSSRHEHGSSYTSPGNSAYVTAPSSRVGQTRPLTESALRMLPNDDDDWEDDDRDARSEKKSRRKGSGDEKRRKSTRSEKDRSRSRSRERTERRKESSRAVSSDEKTRTKNKERSKREPELVAESSRAIPEMGSFDQFPGQHAGGMIGQPVPRQDAMMSGGLPSSVPEQQFPAQPTRADSFGAAAEYYLDEGQSVSFQPGNRPFTPNMLVNPDLHLHAATASPHPIEDTGNGAAADFYSGKVSPVYPVSAPVTPAKPPKTSKIFSSSASKPSRTPRPQHTTPSPAATAALATAGVGTMASSHNNHQSSFEYQAASLASKYQQTNSEFSSKPLKPGRTTSDGDVYYAQPQSSSTSIYPPTLPPINGAAPQAQTPSGTPGKQSTKSNIPLYAAGAAAAGLAAYEYTQHDHSHSQQHTSSYNMASADGLGGGGHGPPRSPRPGAGGSGYYSHNGPGSGMSMQQHQFHEHKGPMARLKDGILDLISSPEDTAKMEMYTEYIGVCKHCFDPRTSAWDAPRVHHYHQRRDSFESLRRRRSHERIIRKGSSESLRRKHSTRVDKDNRYYASESSRRRRESGETGVLGAGLAAAGVAAGANALFNERRNFDDTYSIKSGHRESSAVRRRSRSSSRERRRRSSHGVVRSGKDEFVTVRLRDGTTERRRVARDGRSHSRDRKYSFLGTAAAGAALGAVGVAASHRHHSKSRSRSRSPSVLNGASGTRLRRSDHRSLGRSSTYGQGQSQQTEGFFGGFFSPPQTKRRSSREHHKKRRGFFTFSNGSSSSSNSELAFGDAFPSRASLPLSRKSSNASTRTGRRATRNRSDERLAATVAGIGATAAAIAAAQRGNRVSKRSSRPELGKRREVRYSTDHPASSGDEWEDELPSDIDDESSVDGGLAFGDYKGKRLSSRQSLESVGSQSSAGGLGAWGWRWGGKDQRRKSRTPSSQQRQYPPSVGSFDPSRPINKPVYLDDTGRPLPSIDSTSTASAGQGPLRFVEPQPLSEAGSLPGSRHASMPGAFGDDPPVIRPGPGPIQHPQPISPAQPAFTQSPPQIDNPYSTQHVRTRRADSSPARGSLIQDAALVGAAALATGTIIAGSTSRKSKDTSNVRFGLTEEQQEREDRSRRKDEQKTVDEERRRADRARAVKEEAERAAREARQEEVRRAREEENRRRAEVELERQRAAQRDAEMRAQREREIELARLEQMRLAREAKEREQREREKEKARLERERLEREASERQEAAIAAAAEVERLRRGREEAQQQLEQREHERREREEAEARQQARIDDESRRQEAIRLQREAEEQERYRREQEPERYERYQRERKDVDQKHSSSWGPVAAGAVAAATMGAVMAGREHEKSRGRQHREDSYHDDAKADRSSYLSKKDTAADEQAELNRRAKKQYGRGHNGVEMRNDYVAAEITPKYEHEGEPLMDDDIFNPDYFKEKHSSQEDPRYAEFARRAADKVVAEQRVTSASPERDNYADFFAPKELLSKAAEGKTRSASPHADNEIQVYHARDAEIQSHFPTSDYGYGRSKHAPYGVPRLNVIAPTPPPSEKSSPANRRGKSPLAKSPLTQDDDFEVEGSTKSAISGKSERSRSISWGEDMTHVYDVETPDSHYDRDSYVTSPDIRAQQTAADAADAAEVAGAAFVGKALHEIVVEDPSGEEHKYNEDEWARQEEGLSRPRHKKAGKGEEDDNEIEEVTPEPEPHHGFNFYRQPFADSVSDMGTGVFNLDSPGTEGAPPVRGFIEGETEESTSIDEKTPHIPGGFQDDIDDIYRPRRDKNESESTENIKEEAASADASHEREAAEEPVWEPPLSKKDKKKREKAAKRASIAESDPPTPVTESAPSATAETEEQAEPAEYFPTSKKDKKKAKKQGFADIAKSVISEHPKQRDIVPDVPAASESEPPLSKKEQKKRDKEAKKQGMGFADVTDTILAAGGVVAAAAALDSTEDSGSGSGKKKKKGKKAKLGEPSYDDPRDMKPATDSSAESPMPGTWDDEPATKDQEIGLEKTHPAEDVWKAQDKEASTPPAAPEPPSTQEVDPWTDFAVPKKSKKKSKRNSAAFNAPDISSPLRSEVPQEDYLGEFKPNEEVQYHEERSMANGDYTDRVMSPSNEPNITQQTANEDSNVDEPVQRDRQREGSDERKGGDPSRQVSPDDARSAVSAPLPDIGSHVKSRRDESRGSYDDYEEPSYAYETQSVAASEPADTHDSSRKSKRRSRHADDDDNISVISSRSRRDREKEESPSSKKEKKGGLFGIFSRKSVDDARSSKDSKYDGAPLSRESTRESRGGEDDDESRRRRKKKHRSSEYGDDDDDSRSVKSESRHHRSRSEYGDEDNEERSKSESRHRHRHSEADIDGSRARRRHGTRDEDYDRASPARSEPGRSHRHRREAEDDGESGRHHHRRRTDEDAYGLRNQSFLGMRVEDLPPLPVDRPAKPDSAAVKQEQGEGSPANAESGTGLVNQQRDMTAPEPSDKLLDKESPEQDTDHQGPPLETPPRLGTMHRHMSSTAVPLRFPFGSAPATPASLKKERAQSFSSPIVQSSPMSPMSGTRTRQGRPHSNEIRPLYLVERTRKTPEVEDHLPSLPSSKPSSRASSIHESDDNYQSAVEELEADSPGRHRSLTIDTVGAAAYQREDYLDSQETTPKASHFQHATGERPSKQAPQFYTWEDFARDEQMHDDEEGRALRGWDASPEQPMTATRELAEIEPSVLPRSRSKSPYKDEHGNSYKPVAAVAMLGTAAVYGYHKLQKSSSERQGEEEIGQQPMPTTEPTLSSPLPAPMEEPTTADPVKDNEVVEPLALTRKSSSKKKKSKKGRKQSIQEDDAGTLSVDLAEAGAASDQTPDRSTSAFFDGEAQAEAGAMGSEPVSEVVASAPPTLMNAVDTNDFLQAEIAAEEGIAGMQKQADTAPEDDCPDLASKESALDRFLHQEKEMEDGTVFTTAAAHTMPALHEFNVEPRAPEAAGADRSFEKEEPLDDTHGDTMGSSDNVEAADVHTGIQPNDGSAGLPKGQTDSTPKLTRKQSKKAKKKQKIADTVNEEAEGSSEVTPADVPEAITQDDKSLLQLDEFVIQNHVGQDVPETPVSRVGAPQLNFGTHDFNSVAHTSGSSWHDTQAQTFHDSMTQLSASEAGQADFDEESVPALDHSNAYESADDTQRTKAEPAASDESSTSKKKGKKDKKKKQAFTWTGPEAEPNLLETPDVQSQRDLRQDKSDDNNGLLLAASAAAGVAATVAVAGLAESSKDNSEIQTSKSKKKSKKEKRSAPTWSEADEEHATPKIDDAILEADGASEPRIELSQDEPTMTSAGGSEPVVEVNEREVVSDELALDKVTAPPSESVAEHVFDTAPKSLPVSTPDVTSNENPEVEVPTEAQPEDDWPISASTKKSKKSKKRRSVAWADQVLESEPSSAVSKSADAVQDTSAANDEVDKDTPLVLSEAERTEEPSSLEPMAFMSLETALSETSDTINKAQQPEPDDDYSGPLSFKKSKKSKKKKSLAWNEDGVEQESQPSGDAIDPPPENFHIGSVDLADQSVPEPIAGDIAPDEAAPSTSTASEAKIQDPDPNNDESADQSRVQTSVPDATLAEEPEAHAQPEEDDWAAPLSRKKSKRDKRKMKSLSSDPELDATEPASVEASASRQVSLDDTAFADAIEHQSVEEQQQQSAPVELQSGDDVVRGSITEADASAFDTQPQDEPVASQLEEFAPVSTKKSKKDKKKKKQQQRFELDAPEVQVEETQSSDKSQLVNESGPSELVDVSQPADEPQPIEEPQPVEVPQPVEEPQPVEVPQPVEEPQPVKETQLVEESKPVDEPQPAEAPFHDESADTSFVDAQEVQAAEVDATRPNEEVRQVPDSNAAPASDVVSINESISQPQDVESETTTQASVSAKSRKKSKKEKKRQSAFDWTEPGTEAVRSSLPESRDVSLVDEELPALEEPTRASSSALVDSKSSKVEAFQEDVALTADGNFDIAQPEQPSLSRTQSKKDKKKKKQQQQGSRSWEDETQTSDPAAELATERAVQSTARSYEVESPSGLQHEASQIPIPETHADLIEGAGDNISSDREQHQEREIKNEVAATNEQAAINVDHIVDHWHDAMLEDEKAPTTSEQVIDNWDDPVHVEPEASNIKSEPLESNDLALPEQREEQPTRIVGDRDDAVVSEEAGTSERARPRPESVDSVPPREVEDDDMAWAITSKKKSKKGKKNRQSLAEPSAPRDQALEDVLEGENIASPGPELETSQAPVDTIDIQEQPSASGEEAFKEGEDDGVLWGTTSRKKGKKGKKDRQLVPEPPPAYEQEMSPAITQDPVDTASTPAEVELAETSADSNASPEDNLESVETAPEEEFAWAPSPKKRKGQKGIKGTSSGIQTPLAVEDAEMGGLEPSSDDVTTAASSDTAKQTAEPLGEGPKSKELQDAVTASSPTKSVPAPEHEASALVLEDPMAEDLWEAPTSTKKKKKGKKGKASGTQTPASEDVNSVVGAALEETPPEETAPHNHVQDLTAMSEDGYPALTLIQPSEALAKEPNRDVNPEALNVRLPEESESFFELEPNALAVEEVDEVWSAPTTTKKQKKKGKKGKASVSQFDVPHESQDTPPWVSESKPLDQSQDILDSVEVASYVPLPAEPGESSHVPPFAEQDVGGDVEAHLEGEQPQEPPTESNTERSIEETDSFLPAKPSKKKKGKKGKESSSGLAMPVETFPVFYEPAPKASIAQSPPHDTLVSKEAVTGSPIEDNAELEPTTIEHAHPSDPGNVQSDTDVVQLSKTASDGTEHVADPTFDDIWADEDIVTEEDSGAVRDLMDDTPQDKESVWSSSSSRKGKKGKKGKKGSGPNTATPLEPVVESTPTKTPRVEPQADKIVEEAACVPLPVETPAQTADLGSQPDNVEVINAAEHDQDQAMKDDGSTFATLENAMPTVKELATGDVENVSLLNSLDAEATKGPEVDTTQPSHQPLVPALSEDSLAEKGSKKGKKGKKNRQLVSEQPGPLSTSVSAVASAESQDPAEAESSDQWAVSSTNKTGKKGKKSKQVSSWTEEPSEETITSRPAWSDSRLENHEGTPEVFDHQQDSVEQSAVAMPTDSQDTNEAEAIDPWATTTKGKKGKKGKKSGQILSRSDEAAQQPGEPDLAAGDTAFAETGDHNAPMIVTSEAVPHQERLPSRLSSPKLDAQEQLNNPQKLHSFEHTAGVELPELRTTDDALLADNSREHERNSLQDVKDAQGAKDADRDLQQSSTKPEPTAASEQESSETFVVERGKKGKKKAKKNRVSDHPWADPAEETSATAAEDQESAKNDIKEIIEPSSAAATAVVAAGALASEGIKAEPEDEWADFSSKWSKKSKKKSKKSGTSTPAVEENFLLANETHTKESAAVPDSWDVGVRDKKPTDKVEIPVDEDPKLAVDRESTQLESETITRNDPSADNYEIANLDQRCAKDTVARATNAGAGSDWPSQSVHDGLSTTEPADREANLKDAARTELPEIVEQELLSVKDEPGCSETDANQGIHATAGARSASPTHHASSDIDFTATVAAGLADSGFNPDMVINDPVFQRRASPPGSIGEANPEEDVASITTKQKKGKKSKIPDNVVHSPAAEASTNTSVAPAADTSTGNNFNDTISESLKSTGFDPALLGRALVSTETVLPEKNFGELEDFAFTTTKRKKGKKDKKSEYSESLDASGHNVTLPVHTENSVGSTERTNDTASDAANDLPANSDQPPVQDDPHDTRPEQILGAALVPDVISPSTKAMQTDKSVDILTVGRDEMDMDEMDRQYKAYRKNKRKQKKLRAIDRAAEQSDNPESAMEDTERSNAVSDSEALPRNTTLSDTRPLESALDRTTYEYDRTPRKQDDTPGKVAARGIVSSVFPGLERVKRRTTPTSDEHEKSPGKSPAEVIHTSEIAQTLPKEVPQGSSRAQYDKQPSTPSRSVNTEPAISEVAATLGAAALASQQKHVHVPENESSWSFAALGNNDSASASDRRVVRDGVYEEGKGPSRSISHEQANRDVPEILHTSSSRDSLRQRRSLEPLRIPTSERQPWDIEIPKSRQNEGRGRALESHSRTPSADTPLKPTSKDRASYLFQSPPDILAGIANGNSHSSDPHTPSKAQESEHHSEARSTPRETTAYHHHESHGDENTLVALASLPNNDVASPKLHWNAISEEHHATKRRKADSDVGGPEQIKALQRTETPQRVRARQHTISPSDRPRINTPSQITARSTSNPLSTDELINRLSWPSVDEQNDTVHIDRNLGHRHSRPMLPDPRSPSVMSNRSNASGAHFRSPQELRSYSRSSNRSSTPSLRRTSLSGDLRAVSRRGDAGSAVGVAASPITIPFEPPPTPPPNDDEVTYGSASRAIDMNDDIFSGYGDAQRSQVSPTRPPSVRKRQSMHISELESRIDQLAAENRTLQEARQYTEQANDVTRDVNGQTLQEALAARDLQLREKDAEINQIKAMLQALQEEVARLVDINGGLTEANRNLVDDTNGRYATLQAEHAEAHEKWHSANRDLETMRGEHGRITSGMKDIVEAEIATALADKNAEILRLREQLDIAAEQIRALQVQIQSSKSSDFLVQRDEDYFDGSCQKLCQHVQQWVLRFSKLSDNRVCRLSTELKDDKLEARLDNAILDGSDVDKLLVDRVRRRDVFMSVVMTMVWEYIFTRYLFGMDREQRQKLKALEKLLAEVGPPRAVAHWRATTLTLLSKRPSFDTQCALDTEAVAHEVFGLLCSLLPPPPNAEQQLLASLQKVITIAVNLSIEMRTQRAEYIMLPPLQPEYDTNGDLVRKVHFNASLMNERSGYFSSNEELAADQAVVKIVLFPLVVKKGDDVGEGEEEIVVCPAQVLVQNDGGRGKKVVRVMSGAMEIDDPIRSRQSRHSLVSEAPGGVGF